MLQQNAIDKAKGIIAKPMPKEWHDRHHALKMEDANKRRIYLSILADKKPYFMRYIYPNLMKSYNTYIKNTSKKAQREFSLSMGELLQKPTEEMAEQELEFVKYYLSCMPVGIGDCVVNRICKRFEKEFDGYMGKRNTEVEFDYTIMKSGVQYSRSQYNAILLLFKDYNRRIKDYAIFTNRERIDSDEAMAHMNILKIEFRNACDIACPNAGVLCEILLDICYCANSTKGFVWNICGGEIVANLLLRNGNRIHFPVLDQNGDIQFGGNKFALSRKELGGNE